jgi:hypothetical protein
MASRLGIYDFQQKRQETPTIEQIGNNKYFVLWNFRDVITKGTFEIFGQRNFLMLNVAIPPSFVQDLVNIDDCVLF